MKLSLNRTHALERLSSAAAIANGKVKEILGNLCIIATEDGCSIEATDTELFCSIKLSTENCEVEKPGTVLLPRDRVLPFLRECTDKQVTIESKLNSVHLKCGKAEVTVPSGNPDEFPKMRATEPASSVTVDSDSFGDMLRRTAFCIDTTSSRFALGGVLLLTESGELLAVGTDGRRLSFVRDVCEGKLEETASIIVPEKALKFLTANCGGGDCKIWSDESCFYFEDATTRLSARLIEGRFPKWRQVIPNLDHHEQITIAHPLAFQSAVKQASIVAVGSETHQLKMTLCDGLLRMECKEPDTGESKVELPIEYNGEPIEVALDYKFLGEFLGLLDKNDHLLMYIRNGTQPVLFESSLQQYVLMPMSSN